MVSQELKIEVINLLRTLPVYHQNSMGTQHTVRCPYCGDSTKHSNHAHFSIKIDLSDDGPMLYNCLRCPVSGILTNDVLAELGLSLSGESYTQMNKFAKSSARKMFNTTGEYTVTQLKIPQYEDNSLNRPKLEYLKQRIGADFSFEECSDLKILLNLQDFVRINEIPGFANCKSDKILNILNENYIGFLSTNNNVITMRNINPTVDKKYRYYKLMINAFYNNPNSFYGVPKSYDIMYTKPVDVHITEGTFDILSVYKNLIGEDTERNFFYAACGFGNVRIIKYLLYYGLNTNVNIHIYADKDKSDYDHKKYLRTIKDTDLVWIKNIYIHRNAFPGEKDYGVPLDHIDDTFMKLKKNQI